MRMHLKLTDRDWSFCLFNHVYLGRDMSIRILRHETGHYLQFRESGLFYFLVVGIVSIVRWWIDVLLHRKWTNKKRHEWYYSAWPENNADKRGEDNEKVLKIWQETFEKSENSVIIKFLDRSIDAVKKGIA